MRREWHNPLAGFAEKLRVAWPSRTHEGRIEINGSRMVGLRSTSLGSIPNWQPGEDKSTGDYLWGRIDHPSGWPTRDAVAVTEDG